MFYKITISNFDNNLGYFVNIVEKEFKKNTEINDILEYREKLFSILANLFNTKIQIIINERKNVNDNWQIPYELNK